LDRSTKQTSRYAGWMPSFMGNLAVGSGATLRIAAHLPEAENREL
jgi:hypothetical protein